MKWQNVYCWREMLGFKILYRMSQKMLKEEHVHICMCMCVCSGQGWMDRQRLLSVKCFGRHYTKITLIDYSRYFQAGTLNTFYKQIQSIKSYFNNSKSFYLLHASWVNMWWTLLSWTLVHGGGNFEPVDFGVHIGLWVCKGALDFIVRLAA